MKINGIMQSNIDFYRYASIKLTDLIIDMNKKIIKNELFDSEDSGIGITLGSLIVLKAAADDSFLACIFENGMGNDAKVYDAAIEYLGSRLKPQLNKDTKVAYDFAVAILRDIAKDGGYLDEDK